MSKQIEVLSIPIHAVTMTEAVEVVFALLKKPGFHLVATANAEMLMRAKEDSELAGVLRQADLVLPDGAGVLWAAERQGRSFPARVTGVDTMKALLKKAVQESTPVYFLGAQEGVAADAVRAIEKEYGPLNIVGIHSGFFNVQEEAHIVRQIKDGGAKLVFVALGVPRQEKWLVQHLSHLDGVVGMGVGGSFDVLAGRLERAPQWMQENRLEWLYRLYKQPQRIGRMMALPKYVWTVLRNKS